MGGVGASANSAIAVGPAFGVEDDSVRLAMLAGGYFGVVGAFLASTAGMTPPSS